MSQLTFLCCHSLFFSLIESALKRSQRSLTVSFKLLPSIVNRLRRNAVRRKLSGNSGDNLPKNNDNVSETYI